MYLKLIPLMVVVALLDFGCAESEHRTKAALEKHSDLYCYKCDNILHGERCLDVKENGSSIHGKCSNDQRICQVKTITISSSTEDTTGQPKLWLLQRNCTKTCEPVCVIIGERTKLRACTTCCETSFCNLGNGANAPRIVGDLRILIFMLLITLRVLDVTDGDRS
ncbi:PREDICTED: uncharacterized protein LOC108560370 [Nicrophorus vespilloides]|uniref:Uncharacterized protein LOC108560370 n=1 Tax=Nicrophorus vespilloides TaxID=110193 RepID=A0ABM1MFM9_NICVS|nr:PREDICTED: uncharacterized protein LOC108560370 [Nicrophorus vespilloides]